MEEAVRKRFEFAKSLSHVRPKDVIHRTAKIPRNVCIGKDGLGWIRKDDGTLYKMPHQGNVIIEADVEIGNYVCIDRAVIGSTVIGEGTKIDNLVHIAHGVKIGKNCIIVAGAVLGGSCEIGDNCFVGMGALIKNKIKIGAGCTIGMGAVVVKNVEDGDTILGNPGRIYDRLI